MRLTSWLVVALLLVGGLSASAEVTLTAGTKAGMNIANSVGDDAADEESRTGLVGGGFLSINFSKWFAIQPELLFSQKGSKSTATRVFVVTDGINEDTVTQQGTFTSKLNYVEIPLLLRFNYVNESDIVPSLYAGPALAFRASPSIEFEGTVTDSTGTWDFVSDENAADIIESTDIGFVFGAMVGIESGDGLVFAEVRYTRGFSSYDATGNYDLKNSAISVMLGVLF